MSSQVGCSFLYNLLCKEWNLSKLLLFMTIIYNTKKQKSIAFYWIFWKLAQFSEDFLAEHIHGELDLAKAGHQDDNAVNDGEYRESGNEPVGSEGAEGTRRHWYKSLHKGLPNRRLLRVGSKVFDDADQAQYHQHNAGQNNDPGGETYRVDQQQYANDQLKQAQNNAAQMLLDFFHLWFLPNECIWGKGLLPLTSASRDSMIILQQM